MKLKKLGIVSLLLFYLCLFLCASDFFAQSLGSLDRESIEKFLKKAKDVSFEKGRGRRTDSWVVDLDNGKIQGKGFFKVTNRTRPNASGGDSYKYVLASYELDKMLDLNLIPPTVERKISKNRGSLMLFLEPPVLSEEDRRQKDLVPPDLDSFNKTINDLIVFEHLIFFPSLCTQRDLGNIMIQTGLNWKVWLVDLSEAFAPATSLIEDCEITDCSDNLFNKIESLNKDEIQANLGPYLNSSEITALLIRKNLIIKKLKEIRAEKD